MSRVFIDTSAWVALFYEDDAMHDEALRIMDAIKARRHKLLISDYIFSESVTTVLARAGHRTAVTVGDYILSSKVLDLVWLDESLKIKAWDYFKKHDDKAFSFTDCTSFVLMKEMNVTKFFSFDDHFKQAGFVEFS